ncbi:MAG: YwaF family protein, partial [Clostridia bacterium]|nr:YwaF family protein [Clostridia bacterium]
ILLLEVYKQINFAFDYNEGDPIWDYAWYSFPYQFCSMPLYVLPFIAFLNNGKVRNACIAFMTYFSLIGGIVVFIYPGDVFIQTIGINIQTMVHHGSQLVLGIYFAVYNRRKFGFKYFLSAIPVFVVLFCGAMLLNFAVHAYFMKNGIGDTFNMFFVSPYYDCTLPVFSSIYQAVPYPIFLFLYILGMSIGASLIFGVQFAITKAPASINQRKLKNV